VTKVTRNATLTTRQPLQRGLRILIADEDKQALEALGQVLQELGHEVIAKAVGIQEVEREIAEEGPEAAMVKLHEDTDHALELIETIVEEADCPVLALMEVESLDFVGKAADRGIYAYTESLSAEDVQGAIEIAIRRHAELEHFKEAVNQLEGALDRRAIIERAKGIIMERHSLGEAEAFEVMRAHARRNNRKVIEVAHAVTEGHALLPKAAEGSSAAERRSAESGT
jgi:AmiR/NasT family two-component response regulator